MTEQQILHSGFTVLAVDPGLSGAVARLGHGEIIVRRDFKKLTDIARAIRDLAPGCTHAVMEFVHAMPGQGVCSMFSFGRAAGVADGALALCLSASAELVEVSPQKWQQHFRRVAGIGKDAEFDSRSLARSIVPSSSPYLLRKLDHNTADAILMAVWKQHTLAGRA